MRSSPSREMIERRRESVRTLPPQTSRVRVSRAYCTQAASLGTGSVGALSSRRSGCCRRFGDSWFSRGDLLRRDDDAVGGFQRVSHSFSGTRVVPRARADADDAVAAVRLRAAARRLLIGRLAVCRHNCAIANLVLRCAARGKYLTERCLLEYSYRSCPQLPF